MRILDGIRGMLKSKSAVQMVADDPQMSSEILLLLRMMFADGQMTPDELKMFKMMCRSLFNIAEDDVAEVVNFLKDYGYETSGEQAAAVFANMNPQRKQELMVHMITMARADKKIHEKEVELISRAAQAIGYSAEEVKTWL